MPNQLSYPALKSVLEYVVIEKRIHLTSRSKFLQPIDKTTPVRAKHFKIRRDQVSLDSYRFIVKHEPWYSNEDKKNGKLMMSYLKRRSSVNVDEAVFSGVKTSHDIPVKFDFIVNKLTTHYSNFETVLPMINLRSLPLTDLTIIMNESTNVDHGIVHSAKNVSFVVSPLRTALIGVEKLPNKTVRFQRNGLHISYVVKIIRCWMENGKEVGTEFTIAYSTNFHLREVMASLQEEFHSAQEYLEEINEHILSGFFIQLRSNSKLNVSAIEKLVEGQHIVYQLVLKVM